MASHHGRGVCDADRIARTGDVCRESLRRVTAGCTECYGERRARALREHRERFVSSGSVLERVLSTNGVLYSTF
jgi:hypothetical protein